VFIIAKRLKIEKNSLKGVGCERVAFPPGRSVMGCPIELQTVQECDATKAKQTFISLAKKKTQPTNAD